MAAVHRRFAALRVKLKSGGISRVKVPADPNEPPSNSVRNWSTVTEPDQVLDKLLERVQHHFGKADGSTWTSGPLDTSYDFTGACERADETLDGLHEPDATLSPQAIKLIELLTYAEDCKESIPWEITPAEFKGKIMHWDERKSTSPNTGIHLGHAKAYFARHSCPEGSKEAIELEEWRTSIMEGHLLLLNYAIKFGIPTRDGR